MKSIRVVVVDDHDLFRDGVTAILGHAVGIEVVGGGADATEAHELVLNMRPDILLLDVEMPGAGITATLGRLRRAAPGTKVIILTMHRDRILSAELRRMGAAAFVTKAASSAELIGIIRKVHASRIDSEDGCLPSALRALLSPREMEVLRLIAKALSNAEIASLLSISVGTVKRHVSNLYKKLGAASRLEAIRRASLLGIPTN